MRRQQPASGRWLAPTTGAILILFVAFHHSSTARALQQQQVVGPGDHQLVGEAPASTGPGASHQMMSPVESSSALESSAAADDLIAAESSQSPDAPAEHKAFTQGAQMIRQDPQQQMGASMAPPVFAGPPVQQQQQQQPPQQQIYPQANGGQLAARLQPPHKANFNPFMAAALAGNYGPAQQQIAAAAAASLHAHGQVPHAPVHHHQQHQHQQPQHGPAPINPQHAHQQQQQQHHHHHQHHQHHQHQQQQQQQHIHMHPAQMSHQQQMGPMQQAAPQPQQAQQAPMAVQESAVRHNIVPAPPAQAQYSPAVPDSNSIELNEVGPSAAAAGGLAAAASGQHAVVATATSLAPSASSTVVTTANGGQPQDAWPLQAPDIPKIVNLEVKCEKNLMKVSIEFDKLFNGVIFSKGHFNQGQCVHVQQMSGKQQAYFDISINSCGTQGNTQNGLYGMGGNTGSGTYFENTIVIQYDPNVQEVYDHARKLRCTWHDQYEKAVTFRPFPVDMLDIVRADFAGDNVGCWMQIQVGKGPWASEVAGIVKIGQTMTMVLAIKDEENKFDMLVRNCFAHDGKRGPIELVDKSGCITRPKLMSRFTKIKNFGSSATVLSYAHFQAFKFPDSMEVHFQCTIQICRHQCPEQCSSSSSSSLSSGLGAGERPNALGGESYSESTISGTFNINSGGQAVAVAPSGGGSVGAMDSMHLRKYGSPAASLSRERRDTAIHHLHHHINQRRWLNGSQQLTKPATQTVGLNRIIQVVSTGDLAFALQQARPEGDQVDSQQQQQQQQLDQQPEASQLTRVELANGLAGNQICMSSYNFVLALVMLVLILLCSAMLAVSLYVRQRSLIRATAKTNHYQQQGSSSTLNKLLVASNVQQQQQHQQQQQQQQPTTTTTTHSHPHNHHHHHNHHHVPTSKQQGFY